MEAALFFWFAGISDQLRHMLMFTGILLSLIGCIGWLVYSINSGNVRIGYEVDWRSNNRERYHTVEVSSSNIAAREFWKTGISQFSMVWGVILLIVGLLLPPKNTIYLMAGGFLGQSLIQSDTGEKMKKIIDAHLDEQIEKLMKK